MMDIKPITYQKQNSMPKNRIVHYKFGLMAMVCLWIAAHSGVAANGNLMDGPRAHPRLGDTTTINRVVDFKHSTPLCRRLPRQ